MKTLLPVITLLIGIVLNELLTQWRSRRDRSAARLDRYEKFVGDALIEALDAMDDAYDAAVVIGLNSDKHGTAGGAEAITTDEHWSYREPFVTAVGKEAMRLRRIAVLLPEAQSPRIELETMAQAVADMVGQGTARQISDRFKRVDAAILPAREAIAQELRRLYSA
ncbi:hypothetical protein AB0L70_13300 [Kribbella sp. NPDC051952]|uniref:hypothetical protein n=1 Tax=Kribbella sp. NPDC051952 TaxID=3154851 RepID=UPI003434C628